MDVKGYIYREYGETETVYGTLGRMLYPDENHGPIRVKGWVLVFPDVGIEYEARTLSDLVRRIDKHGKIHHIGPCGT